MSTFWVMTLSRPLSRITNSFLPSSVCDWIATSVLIRQEIDRAPVSHRLVYSAAGLWHYAGDDVMSFFFAYVCGYLIN
jgi:hypothetical protein